MAKSKRKTEPDQPVSAVHGPSAPVATLHGTARLRSVLRLSDAVNTEQLADDAASEIQALREGRHWPRSATS